MALDSVTDGMKNKVGPLPIWAWVGIPAGLYVLWSYYQASKQPETVETASSGGSADTEEWDYGLNTGGSYLPSYGAAPQGTSNLPLPSTPEFTNESWFRTVSNWLIGEGVSPTDVVTALNAYLYGTPETITSTQGDALSRALMKYGAAPSPAFIPKIQPAPTGTNNTDVSDSAGTSNLSKNVVTVNSQTMVRVIARGPNGERKAMTWTLEEFHARRKNLPPAPGQTSGTSWYFVSFADGSMPP